MRQRIQNASKEFLRSFRPPVLQLVRELPKRGKIVLVFVQESLEVED